MNHLIQNFSMENNFKLLSRRLTVESFDVFVRGSPIFGQQICLRTVLTVLGIDK